MPCPAAIQRIALTWVPLPDPGPPMTNTTRCLRAGCPGAAGCCGTCAQRHTASSAHETSSINQRRRGHTVHVGPYSPGMNAPRRCMRGRQAFAFAGSMCVPSPILLGYPFPLFPPPPLPPPDLASRNTPPPHNWPRYPPAHLVCVHSGGGSSAAPQAAAQVPPALQPAERRRQPSLHTRTQGAAGRAGEVVAGCTLSARRANKHAGSRRRRVPRCPGLPPCRHAAQARQRSSVGPPADRRTSALPACSTRVRHRPTSNTPRNRGEEGRLRPPVSASLATRWGDGLWQGRKKGGEKACGSPGVEVFKGERAGVLGRWGTPNAPPPVQGGATENKPELN